MRFVAEALIRCPIVAAFVAGGLVGSILTQVLLPSADWESCRELGVASVVGSASHTTPKLCSDAVGLRLPIEIDCRGSRVNGTYNIKSRFTGPPSPEVEAAWERYWRVWTVSVDEAAFRASQPQHPEAAVRFEGGKHNGRYLATLEAVHQMHCLYNLFQASYVDWSPGQRAEYDRDASKWHERVDHCVEVLRQKLECDRDTTLITYNWVKHKKGPTANFNVARACPSWDAMDDWSQHHEVTEIPGKPADAIELAVFP